MAQSNVIGRQPEKKIFQQALDSPGSEFIAVYGRRRIGKTFLVREFFEGKIIFELSGILNGTLPEQLENFTVSLGKALGVGLQPKIPSTWREAFLQIEQFIDSTAEATVIPKRVVFLDELPWLNTPRSNFLPALQHFWNNYCSKRKDIILVVCGSAASWMIHQIVRSKGGLHNRLTRQIRLLPFTLFETKQYLLSKNITNLNNYSIIQIYMALGGVPFYLSKVEPGKSPAQIIDALCFTDSGALRFEYDQLYRSLFDNSDQHMKIVEFLSKKRKGNSRSEIIENTGSKSGGTFSKIMEELEESGFITSQVPFAKKANDALYRLTDEFSLFHLQWIKPLGKKNPGNGYWMTRQNNPKFRSWSGYSFEGICMKHVEMLKSALGIAKVSTTESPWRYVPSKKTEETGAQIDLLIDRADNTINLCEMKFYNSEFTIDAAFASSLRTKIKVFKEQTGTRKNLFVTMITTFGTAKNSYSNELEVIDLSVDELF